MATTADLLNIALSVGVIVLVIFLGMALFNLALILRDVSKLSSETRRVAEEPLKIISMIMEKITPAIKKKMGDSDEE